MIRVSILYPNHPGSTFDLDRYVTTHMPRAIQLLSTHITPHAWELQNDISRCTDVEPVNQFSAVLLTA